MASKQSNRGSKATPTAQNRNQQARPGDATGQERERLQREHAAEIQQAATQTTLVNPPPRVERMDEVVDYTDGGDPNPGADQGVRLISMDEAVSDGSTLVGPHDVPEDQIDLDSLPDGKSDVRPDYVELTEQPRPAHERPQVEQAAPAPQVEQRAAPVVTQAHRVMRVNTDLEDITIGKDNHYSFYVGTPYKVPAHVYQHLDEKGYVLR